MLSLILLNMKRIWFKAKNYGYGWYPYSWQGWSLTLLYILTLLVTFRIIDLRSHSGYEVLMEMFVPFVILTLLLIAICVKTGEKARWRWGK